MQNPNQGLVRVAVRFSLGGEREQARLAHLADVGELLVVVAVGQRRHVLLVGFADGVVVVEVRVSVDQHVVDPGAEQTRRSQLEELGELVGEERKEPIEEEEDYQDPFEHCVDHKVWERAQLLFDETRE